MQELHAGYVSSALWSKTLHGDLSDDLDWQSVLRHLCHFVIDSPIEPVGEIDPITAICENLVSRGLPTLPTLFVERSIAERTSITDVKESGHKAGTQSFDVSFSTDFQTLKPDIERALCISSNNFTIGASPGFSLPNYGSDAEKQFLHGQLSKALLCAIQLVERERPFSSLVEETPSNLKDSRIDYCIELPGSKKTPGFIIELDGKQHENLPDVLLDIQRDKTTKVGWKTIRVKVEKLHEQLKPHQINEILDHPYIKRLHDNNKRPLMEYEQGQRILDFVISPIAIARIQAVLIRLIHAGKLRLDAETWNI